MHYAGLRSRFPRTPQWRAGSCLSPLNVPADARLAASLHDVADLVEMRVDVVGHPVEAIPFLPKVRRLVGRLQLLAAAPLYVTGLPASAAVGRRHRIGCVPQLTRASWSYKLMRHALAGC